LHGADTRLKTGGSIGAGFFVGSGGALEKGGPATLILDFAIIGVMMFNVGESWNHPSWRDF
jgi:amino acid permease